MQKIEYLNMRRLEDSHFWFQSKRSFVDSVLYKHKHEIQNVLDIGSGTGGMTNHLQKYGNVTGIESNRTAIKLSKGRNLNIITGDANKLGLRDCTFDLVTIFDVLYHKNIISEKDVLNESHRVLKNGGLILITDSAFEFLKSIHDVTMYGERRYTLESMRKIVKKSGFKIIRSTYIFTSIFPFVLIKRLFIDKIIKGSKSDVTEIPWLLNKFLLYILKIESAIIRFVNFSFGVSVLILAQKNDRKRKNN